jgi:alkaline phosphatase D
MISTRNALFLLLCACSAPTPAGPRLTHGPAVGDVGPDRAVVWARFEGIDRVRAELTATGAHGAGVRAAEAPCSAGGTVRIAFLGLEPGREYEVSFPGLAGAPRRAFTTAPGATDAVPLRIAFGGDVGGQGLGRDERLGIPAFRAVLARRPSHFLGIGDMIYADNEVPARGKLGNAQVPLSNPMTQDRASFAAHWRYLHDDAGFAELLLRTPYVAIWDDHEVRNDFGPHDDGGLLPLGLDALFEWNPLAGTAEEPRRLYRSLRLGRHCELFVLDCRQYRDANPRKDDGREPKTMLGKAQREWLLDGLARSDATWKLIVTSVPLSTPTGGAARGRDSWCDHETPSGFERELVALLRAMQRAGIARPVFLTTDVHHAEVIRYRPFADAPEFEPLEVVTGPLHAGTFGRTALDATLRPESLFYRSPEKAPASLEEALRWFNFGVVEIGADGELSVEVVAATGESLFRSPWARAAR